jgi:hypothetical protein
MEDKMSKKGSQNPKEANTDQEKEEIKILRDQIVSLKAQNEILTDQVSKLEETLKMPETDKETDTIEQKKRKKIRYRKIGGGSFRTKQGRIIKPNQTFYAYPEDIPKGFKDVIRPVDEVAEAEEEPIVDSEPARFEIRHKSGPYYDVYNSSIDKKINEKGLKKEDAEELIKELS